MSSTERALKQATELPLKVSKELCEGKTYIVTGANVGLGLEAARHLVSVGAGKVVMAVRNLEAGATARDSIEASTGIKGVAEVWHLDLSSHASVIAFASKARETLERIEAVIENAAVASSGGDKAEGHLLALTVNVVSTFLLLVLLLPKLRRDSAKFAYMPRLSVVTSGTSFDMGDYWQKVAENSIENMDADKQLGMMVYPMSKLMEVFAVREISRLLPVARGGVIINSLDPGLCETTLSRNAPQAFQEQLKQMWAQNGRTAECGSRTLLAGAVAGEDSHGSYMDSCAVRNDLVPGWVDDAANKKAWTSIVKELEKIQPGCVSKAFE